MQDMLDMFHLLKEEGGKAERLLEELGTRDEYVTDVLDFLTKDDKTISVDNVKSNLEHLHSRKDIVARLQGFMSYLREYTDTWIVDETGNASNPPTVPSGIRNNGIDPSKLTLTHVELGVLRWVAFVSFPSAVMSERTVQSLHDELLIGCPQPKMRGSLSCKISLQRSPSSIHPSAVIMCGPPGSGKTYSMKALGEELAKPPIEGPPLESWVHIDPDFWISHLLSNDNKLRNLANFLNHELFLTAIGEKRNIIFDGTGRNLMNTCGRVISRLKQANYRVFICIVLADTPTILQRVETRRKETGRGVPEAFVRSCVESLQTVVPVYLRGVLDAKLAEVVFLFDSTSGTVLRHKLESNSRQEDVEAAVVSATELLKMDPPSS